MVEKIINFSNLLELLKKNKSYQQLIGNVKGKVFENHMENISKIYIWLFEALTMCIENEDCKTFIPKEYTVSEKYITFGLNTI